MDQGSTVHGSGSAGGTNASMADMQGMQGGKTQDGGQGMGKGMEECIKQCTNCHNICLQTVAYCLQMGGKHSGAQHITVLLDCAEACQTSANFMLRGSQLHSRECGVCAEACERCAESCEQVGGGDTQMQACAEECRRCAESCKRMASMM